VGTIDNNKEKREGRDRKCRIHMVPGLAERLYGRIGKMNKPRRKGKIWITITHYSWTCHQPSAIRSIDECGHDHG
jgi:hypothetical protein